MDFSSGDEPSKNIPSETEQNFLILPHFIKPIWSKAEPILLKLSTGKISSVFDFMEMLTLLISLHYFPSKSPYNLAVLLQWLESLEPAELQYFLRKFLPFIGKIALNIRELFPKSLKIFKANEETSQDLTKKQIACLISHMFLCTFHHQKDPKLPKSCNFSQLYHSESGFRNSLKITKLQCIYNYLKRSEQNLNKINCLIVYQRLVTPPTSSNFSYDFWIKSKKPLSSIEFHNEKFIEDSGSDYMQVVFANKELGGGVLNLGGLQEELRFCMNPEMFPAMLLFEILEDYEAVLYLGCERYNSIKGYGEKAKFKENFIDNSSVDVFEKKDVCIVGIDSIDFSLLKDIRAQYRKHYILRDINKAYIGFTGSDLMNDKPKKTIATGKWGCGDFKGDFSLKMTLQWLAASQNERDIGFFFIEKENLSDFEGFVKKVEGYTVGEMFGYLMDYSKMVTDDNVDIGLFEFIRDFVDT